MSIAQAERLKAELTDKFVVVSDGVPELRRFAGLTGTVKTVNMSCRALVQFDGPVDISWYDIDPAYLQVVSAPQPKKSEAKPEAKGEAAPAVAKPAAAAPAVAKPAGKSPLDAIRAAGAPKPAAATPAASASGAKPSPLDLIRQQAAAKAAGGSAPEAKPAAAVAAETAPPAATAPAAGGAKLSPLEMIRQQAAAKAILAASTAETPVPIPEVPASAVAADVAAPELKAPVVPAAPIPSAAGRPKSTAEVLAAIRQQGGNK